VSLNGWCSLERISTHTKTGFQQALQESIEREGVRNPILVWSLDEGVYLTFGGSRLKACRALGLETVPAIINDHTGAYERFPEVTEQTLPETFIDVPKTYEFGPDGFDYHYNLERARRHAHDPAGFAWIDGEPEFIKQEFPWVIADE